MVYRNVEIRSLIENVRGLLIDCHSKHVVTTVKDYFARISLKLLSDSGSYTFLLEKWEECVKIDYYKQNYQAQRKGST